MRTTDDTLELALAQLLERTEVDTGDPASMERVVDEVISGYPEYSSQLREFWRLHCRFELARQREPAAPSDTAAGSAEFDPQSATIQNGSHPAALHASSSDRQGKGPAHPQPRHDDQRPIEPPDGASDHFAPTLSRSEQASAASEVGINRDASWIGRRLGQYELLEEIDRGGMGVVFKARHRQLDRQVALKIIRSGELADAEELQRFRSEAEAAARLSHPGIVPIFEVGQEGSLVYFTMAYIDGQTLSRRTQESPLSIDESVRLVYKLCQAVHYAHSQGVLHRDLKPGNVLVDATLQPVIIDFGLAKFDQRESELTTTGQILGTPAYMAPEQASGRGHQARVTADIYSLGAILYYLLSGQPPFTGPTAFDVLLQVMDREPPAPSRLNRKVARDLDYLCSRAMDKHAERRYQSAAEMAAELERYLKDEPLELPHYSVRNRMATLWRRSPILVCHVCGIGAAAVVAITSHLLHLSQSSFWQQMSLLGFWLAACFGLQWIVFRAKWRDAGCLAWATVDVILFTWLVFNADAPRTLLLIGYPMMIAASGLFYRTRFVIYMTTICVLGFALLRTITNDESLARPDFGAIFLSGLMVIGLTMHAMIRRIRGMSIFYEGG